MGSGWTQKIVSTQRREGRKELIAVAIPKEYFRLTKSREIRDLHDG
jgi:hypothetical protein